MPRSTQDIDLVVEGTEDQLLEFARRRQEEALGLAPWFATAEDVILAKLEWAKDTGSERQVRDVVGIIESQGGALDRTYVTRWASILGVEQQWRRAQERAWAFDAEQ